MNNQDKKINALNDIGTFSSANPGEGRRRMKLFLLLGHYRGFGDSEKLLLNILASYSLTSVNLVNNEFHYCYYSKPESREADRDQARAYRMCQIRDQFIKEPFIIVGFGWMACDMLLQVGKSNTHTRVGAKWLLVPGGETEAWITYDPAAALLDPNYTVDISWVIVNAAYDADLKPIPDLKVQPFNWDKYL